MMDSNVPEDEATIFRPNPSGRSAKISQVNKTHTFSNAGKMPHDACEIVIFENAFIQHALPVLNFVIGIKTTPTDVNVKLLKSDLLNEVRNYRKDLETLRFDNKSVEDATFGLSAFIDELVLSTPWAEKALWSDSYLLMTLFNVSSGGKRILEILNSMAVGNSMHPELLGFFLTLLELGYQGEFSDLKDGNLYRSQIIQSMVNQISDNTIRSALDKSAGLNKPLPSNLNFRDRLPIWVVFSVVVFTLLLIYVEFQSVLLFKVDQLILDPKTPAASSGSTQ